MEYFLLALLGMAILIICNIRFVPQAYDYVVERFGAYLRTWNTGPHIKIPVIDRVAKRVSLKEQVIDFEPQSVITKDNVTMTIDTVVFFRIMDAKLYTYGVDRPISAIENLSATTLRNIIGDMDLDVCLTSRDLINAKITENLDKASDAWGIKVLRVELKNILPPTEIREAMERQMKAERERRETILKAEGEKQSRILTAEGETEATLLRAKAQKDAVILSAEAEKQSRILAAEAESESIQKIQEATAAGIKLINDSSPSKAFLQMRALEAFEAAADGQATKIIIPSQIQGLAGLATAITSVTKDTLGKGE